MSAWNADVEQAIVTYLQAHPRQTERAIVEAVTPRWRWWRRTEVHQAVAAIAFRGVLTAEWGFDPACGCYEMVFSVRER